MSDPNFTCHAITFGMTRLAKGHVGIRGSHWLISDLISWQQVQAKLGTGKNV